jgi:hypothetical protein
MKAMLVKTVKGAALVQRPSVLRKIATDWFTNGCLKWCLMYSRNLSEGKLTPHFKVFYKSNLVV